MKSISLKSKNWILKLALCAIPDKVCQTQNLPNISILAVTPKAEQSMRQPACWSEWCRSYTVNCNEEATIVRNMTPPISPHRWGGMASNEAYCVRQFVYLILPPQLQNVNITITILRRKKLRLLHLPLGHPNSWTKNRTWVCLTLKPDLLYHALPCLIVLPSFYFKETKITRSAF